MTTTICKVNYAVTVKYILPYPQRRLPGAVRPERRTRPMLLQWTGRSGRSDGRSRALIRRNARIWPLGRPEWPAGGTLVPTVMPLRVLSLPRFVARS